MPQLRSLLAKPPDTDPDVELPKFGDPGVKDDPAIVKALMSFLGLEEQRPGDAASALGAAAGIIGPLAIGRKSKQLLGPLERLLLPPQAAEPVLDSAMIRKLVEGGDTNLFNTTRRPGAGKPPVRPKNPLADGTLPKHKEVIPPFREKSGIALDVLDELSKEPKFAHADKLEDFKAGMTELRGDAYSADGLPISVSKDPVNYVGELREVDNTLGVHPRSTKFDHNPLSRGRQQRGEITSIDQLIQDLSNYFTGPLYDPFKR